MHKHHFMNNISKVLSCFTFAKCNDVEQCFKLIIMEFTFYSPYAEDTLHIFFAQSSSRVVSS